VGLGQGDDPPCGANSFLCWRYSAEEKALLSSVVGGVSGMILGGAIGLAARSENWDPVAPANLQVAVDLDGGLMLAARHRF
jgi:hypothetical protein